jgi:plasmid replication initiation protein
MSHKAIKVANKFIMSRYRLTDIECRLIFHIIGRIKTDDNEFVAYEYTAKELMAAIGVAANNRSYFFGVVDNLFQKIISIDEETGWVKYHWFDIVRWRREDDVLVLRFNDELKPYLLQLRREFTLLDLQCMMKLSVHSRRIYMLAKKDEWQHRDKRISIPEFLDVVGLGKGYLKFQNLKDRVLIPAVKEINELSDIFLEITPDKTTRKGKAYRDLIFTARLKKEVKALPAPTTAAAKTTAAPKQQEPNHVEIEKARRAEGARRKKEYEDKKWEQLDEKDKDQYRATAESNFLNKDKAEVEEDAKIQYINSELHLKDKYHVFLDALSLSMSHAWEQWEERLREENKQAASGEVA